MISRHLLLCCFLAYLVHGQDLQFKCISCADAFDKCELDCSWSLPASDVPAITECQKGCLVTKRRCVDTPEAEACAACALACSEAYDSAMRKCLSGVSRSTISTYSNPQLAACEQKATQPMDACMASCATT